MTRLYTQFMVSKSCLFCAIVDGREPSKEVLDLEEFLVVENKYPKAPIHVLVIDKKHREKSDTIAGVYWSEHYWGKMFDAINKTLDHLGLKKTGYELVNNGAGYNHIEHEHFHILSGYAGGTSPRT